MTRYGGLDETHKACAGLILDAAEVDVLLVRAKYLAAVGLGAVIGTVAGLLLGVCL